MADPAPNPVPEKPAHEPPAKVAAAPAPAAAPPKSKGWSDYVAISTAVIAVVAALDASQLGVAGGRNQILQSQESDQWAFYQAKSIKGHTYDLQSQMLELLPPDPALDAARKARHDDYVAQSARYEKERGEIKAEAEKKKNERLVVVEHAARYGRALIALQVSIVLSSVAGMTKKKWLWLLSLGLGALGVAGFCWGYFF
ncbi:MAG TPA: DUF4337 domain-containing protein [Myxococcales bacterium]|jgi:hypothetical protein